MSDSDFSDTSYDPNTGSPPHSPSSEVSTDDSIYFSDSDQIVRLPPSPAESIESCPSPNVSVASTISNHSDSVDLTDFEDYVFDYQSAEEEEHAIQEYDVTQWTFDEDDEILPEYEEEGENMDIAQYLFGDTSDDDEVMLVEDPVETIDLCNESFVAPARPYFRTNTDGAPQMMDLCAQAVPRPHHFPTQSAIDLSPQRLPASRNLAAAANDMIEIADSPVLNRKAGASHTATQAVKIPCPICFESIVENNPVSTQCGHLFCEQCIQLCLQEKKMCPMCQTKLPDKSPYHSLFF